MATASHENLPDLPATLAKAHHRGPISDLWGPTLTHKAKSANEPAYALDLAKDTSRGPLMSSASSVTIGHESLDEKVVPKDTSSVASTISSSTPLSSGSTLWPTSSPSSAASTSSGPLMGLAPSKPSGYNIPHPQNPSAPTNTVSSRVSQSVPPIHQFRTGIWGPRQSFTSFSASKPSSGFAQPASVGSSSSYATSAWGMDAAVSSSPPNLRAVHGGAAVHSGIQIPGSIPSSSINGAAVSSSLPPTIGGMALAPSANIPAHQGYYGMPAANAGSLASQNTVGSKNITPPHTSPTPPNGQTTLAGQNGHTGQNGQTVPGATDSRLYQTTPSHLNMQHQNTHAQSGHGQNVQMNRGHYNQDNPSYMRNFKKNGRPSTNTELYKTELCASYMSTGGNCPYGEKCQFAHGPQELKTVDRPPKWRSKPCQNWVRTGTCSYNERCCFRHDVPIGYGQQQ